MSNPFIPNLTPLAKYIPRWDHAAMFIAMAILFTLEMIGVFDGRFVTITAICRAYIPRWARAMICGWLCYHFVIQ